MVFNNPDSEWEKYGSEDPYFGVLTESKYQKGKLTAAAKKEFFKSGANHIQKTFTTVRKRLDSSFKPKRALDFGCGVGRLVIPLARIAKHVDGVDISSSMLKEARKNCKLYAVKNVKFIRTELSSLKTKYDFIHAYIVFQHIPVKRGEEIFRNMLRLLEKNGVCVVHFTYVKSGMNELIVWAKKYVPLAKNFMNLMRGRSFFYPMLEMNNYDLNKLLFMMQENGISDFYTEYTDHGGFYGVILYFQKPKK